LLDLLSPSLLGYLLSFLPQNDPLAETVPGGLLAPEFVERLQAEQFSGYALAKLPGDERAWLALYRGRLLEAWRQSIGGHLIGAVAYRALRKEFSRAILSVYILPAETLPAIIALTRGSPRMVGMAAASVIMPDFADSLAREQFTGALVLEDGSVGRAWYYLRGKRLFGGELLPALGNGRLHLVQSPAKAPPDLLLQIQQEEQQNRKNRLAAIWNAVQEVLKEYMGRGAVLALERLRKAHPSEDPIALEQNLRRWMEQSLEPNAAAMFDRLLESTM